jgi:hypothetical protein
MRAECHSSLFCCLRIFGASGWHPFGNCRPLCTSIFEMCTRISPLYYDWQSHQATCSKSGWWACFASPLQFASTDIGRLREPLTLYKSRLRVRMGILITTFNYIETLVSCFKKLFSLPHHDCQRRHQWLCIRSNLGRHQIATNS